MMPPTPSWFGKVLSAETMSEFDLVRAEQLVNQSFLASMVTIVAHLSLGEGFEFVDHLSGRGMTTPLGVHTNSRIGSRSSRMYRGRPAWSGQVLAGSMPSAWYRVASTFEGV